MNGQTQEVVFQNVSKVFGKSADGRDGFTAVDDLSFSVGKGEMVAVLGKTGCGKSTMFGLLSGLLAPSAGTILVGGHNPFAEFEWFRGKIGIVFQNDRLLPWRTAVENVEYGLELLHVDSGKRRRVALDWLDRLGLSAHANDYPHALSGGMRQRVSIARAFAVNPDILLCDEPFSALDEVTAERLRQEYLALVRENGKTSIFVTHSISEALQIGQHIMVFHRPARIAYECFLQPDSSDAERETTRGKIIEALSHSPAVPGMTVQ